MNDDVKKMHEAAILFVQSAGGRSSQYINEAFELVAGRIRSNDGSEDDAINDALSCCGQLVAMAQLRFMNLIISQAGVPSIGKARQIMEQRVGQLVDTAIHQTIMDQRAGNA